MPFGIRSAPEVWQRKMNELIKNLRDDFVVCGFRDTIQEAVKDHDRNIRAFLKGAREKN